MTKKRIASLAVLILLVSGMYARAYELPELNFAIDVPGTWIVLTRDMEDDDPGPLLLGLDAAAVNAYFEGANIYLNAVYPDFSCELVITMLDYEGSRAVFNLNKFGRKQHEEFAEAVKNSDEAKEAGISYTDYFFYEANGISFVILNFERDGDAYGRQYATVYNGQSVNVTLHSANGEIPAGIAAEFEEIMAGAKFTKTLEDPNPAGSGIDWSSVLEKAAIGAISGAIIGGLGFLFKRRVGRKTAATDTNQTWTPGQYGIPGQTPPQEQEQTPPPRQYILSEQEPPEQE